MNLEYVCLLAVIALAGDVILFALYCQAKEYQYRDYMTQLYNKLYLEKVINKWIKRKKDFTICFFDIDKFKMLNDTYGHLAGDEGIIHLGNVLRECCEGKAIAARIGGDEFAAAFIDCPADKQAAIFDRIRTQCYEYNGKSIRFTVSIGVCRSDRELSYEKLLELTDKKLYESKRNRPLNNISFPMNPVSSMEPVS